MATQALTVDKPDAQNTTSTFLRIAFLMAATVSVNVLVGTFSGEKLSFLYKERLHLGASAFSTLLILLSFPNYLRPVIGGASDLFPIFGYHRRSYYALAALVTAGSYFALAHLHPYTYATTALIVIAAIAGGITLMIMADAVMVSIGNATGMVGRLQTVQQFLPPILSITFAAKLSGHVTQYWSYSRCFEWAALMALFALPLTLLIPEKPVVKPDTAQESPEEREERRQIKRRERAQVWNTLKLAAKSPGLWAVVAFLFYLTLTPGGGTAQFYYSVDTLHFSKLFLGQLGAFGAAGSILGVLTFAVIAPKLSARFQVWYIFVVGCAGYLILLGLHSRTSAEVISFVGSYFGIIATLSTLTLAARACPPGAEGTVYGLLLSAVGLAGTFSDKFGSLIFTYFGPDNKSHDYTTTHGWLALIWIGFAFTVLSALFIPFLPAWARSKNPLRANPEATVAESIA